jgi:hypothetical protein
MRIQLSGSNYKGIFLLQEKSGKKLRLNGLLQGDEIYM